MREMDEVVSGSERGWASGYINWWRYITSLVEAEPQQTDLARMNSFLALMFLTILRADSSLARIVHLGKNKKCVSLCLIIAQHTSAKNENENNESSRFKRIECPEEESAQRRLAASILLVLAGLGVLANLLVVLLLLASRSQPVSEATLKCV